jgi:hypothetical protein
MNFYFFRNLLFFLLLETLKTSIPEILDILFTSNLYKSYSISFCNLLIKTLESRNFNFFLIFHSLFFDYLELFHFFIHDL